MPGVAGDQGKAQSVGAVLVDDVHGVDAVAQRLAHLAALLVAHEPVDEHVVEGTLPVCSMPENIMRITQNGMMS